MQAGQLALFMPLPPQAYRPTPPPGKNGTAAVTEVETQRRFNELDRKLLDNRRELLDSRFKLVDWWLIAIAIVGTIFGYIGFERFREIETQGRQHVTKAEDSAEEASRLLKEIIATRDVASAQLEEITSEVVSKNLEETAETAARVQRDPAAPVIDRAIAAAVQLQQQGKIEEAVEKWRAIANVAGEADRPLQARAWLSVGYLRSVGEGIDLGAAMEAYTKAIERNPTYAEAYNNRGNAKHDLGQHEAAIADLDQAIKLDPTYAEAYYNRGTAKHELGQHEAAIADLDQAIKLDPTLVAPYNNRGNAKHDLGQHEAAIADYDQAIELNPTLAEAYYNRGNAKEILGRIREARADYQQALVLAQEAGKANLVAAVRRTLSRLDHNAEP